VSDDSTTDRPARELGATRPAVGSGVRANRFRGGQRRAARWSRTGAASAFGTAPEERGSQVGWSWEIKRDGGDHRRILVEVIPGRYRVTDFPAEARNAIRSRGATAVDAFLDTEDPPVRIVISTQGLEAHYGVVGSSD
jgi:hypothetical protein